MTRVSETGSSGPLFARLELAAQHDRLSVLDFQQRAIQLHHRAPQQCVGGDSLRAENDGLHWPRSGRPARESA